MTQPATPPPPAWEMISLRKRLGDFELMIQNLAVQPAACLAVIGPAGAGKSTLLQMAAGLMPVDAGSLKRGGVEVGRGEESLLQRRQVTLVAQRPVMLRGSVRYNVQYGLRLRRDRQAATKAEAMIERLQLTPLADQPADSLSGGETQLVAIARALVLQPDYLILDEPTAHLDPGRVQLVEDVVTEMHQQHAFACIWATHNLFQARRVATAAALMLNGRLVETGDAGAFFDSPAQPQTADFLEGRMVY